MLGYLGGPFVLRGALAVHSDSLRRHLIPKRPWLDFNSGYNFNQISRHSSFMTILGECIFLFFLFRSIEAAVHSLSKHDTCVCV